jgi:hypothetical protein
MQMMDITPLNLIVKSIKKGFILRIGVPISHNISGILD